MRVIIAGRLSRKVEDRDQTGFDSQEREAIRWAESNGHQVIGIAADFKTGRSPMMARKNLRPWVAEPDKLSEYDGIVALKLDRLTRGDSQETADLEAWARTHGKSLMTAEGLVFPCEGADGIRWDLAKRLAHDEWLRISERYTRMQRNRREIGSAVGTAPWGFDIAKRNDVKVFAPTAEARIYVPQIYQHVIDGLSLRSIVVWLDAEGVRTKRGGKWDEGTLCRLIQNPIYYGARRGGGNLETEALVSYPVWSQANAALASRRKVGRGTAKGSGKAKALLAPVCGNPDCDATGPHPSPMYRIGSGVGNAKRDIYRCTGRGPQRKGCGNSIVLDIADRGAIHTMLKDTRPHMIREFIAGNATADLIGKLREQAMTAYRAGDKVRFRELDAEADVLEAEAELVKPHWKVRESGMTVGEHFAGLDYDAQREYLATCEVRISREGISIVTPWELLDAS